MLPLKAHLWGLRRPWVVFRMHLGRSSQHARRREARTERSDCPTPRLRQREPTTYLIDPLPILACCCKIHQPSAGRRNQDPALSAANGQVLDDHDTRGFALSIRSAFGRIVTEDPLCPWSVIGLSVGGPASSSADISSATTYNLTLGHI
jgi:hypothetical protein